MSELKALDLFKGEEKGVYKRMAEVIKSGLHKKVDEIKRKLNIKDSEEAIRIIAKKLNVNTGRLTRIYHGNFNNRDVNYEIFRRLEFPFELSIHRVLGKPKSSKDTKIWKEWLQVCQKSPMLGAAAVLRSGHLSKKKITKENVLELYATLRAIREMRINR